jgi:hypothetical protein
MLRPRAKTIGFWRVGLLEKSQPKSTVNWTSPRYDLPMIDAVAISSSSRAKDMLPDTE